MESGCRQRTQFIGMPSRSRTPSRKRRRHATGTKGAKGTDMREQNKFKKQKISGAHSKDSFTFGTTLKINIFFAALNFPELWTPEFETDEAEKEACVLVFWGYSIDLGVESMHHCRQPLVPVLTSKSSCLIKACRETQTNIRTGSLWSLFHQAGSTLTYKQSHLCTKVWGTSISVYIPTTF